jgi:hypothetical protein
MSESKRVLPLRHLLPSDLKIPSAHPFVTPAISLGLLSLALSVVTVTSRMKLWLGPQTLVLGSVGICIGILICGCARHIARLSTLVLLDRPASSGRAIGVIIIAATVLPAAIIFLAFDRFANSADEGAFLFQATTFLHGHLWDAAPAEPGLFAQNDVVAHNGIWISQYLPGWPAVLALFQAIHLPWLAAPMCGAALLLLLWTALRLECTRPAMVVPILAAYASTGFFLLNASTYFSHCVSAVTVVGSIVCILRAERNPLPWWPIAAGACFGAALLCRLDSAALAGTAILAGWIEQGCKRRTFLLGFVGAAPLLALFCIYNTLVTGSPLLIPTAWAGNISLGTHGLIGTDAPEGRFRMLVQTAWRTGELADTASLILPGLYFVSLYLRLRSLSFRFFDFVPLANFAVFLIYPDLGGFQMGPRYWFDGFIVMHITVASVFSRQTVEWQRFIVACCLLLVPVSLARLPGQVLFEARVMHERSSVFRLAAALPRDGRSIILINDFDSAFNERANRTAPNLAKDVVRNGISLDKPVLFARGDVLDALPRACALYPQASIFAFNLDSAHPDGWLAPLACAPHGA